MTINDLKAQRDHALQVAELLDQRIANMRAVGLQNLTLSVTAVADFARLLRLFDELADMIEQSETDLDAAKWIGANEAYADVVEQAQRLCTDPCRPIIDLGRDTVAKFVEPFQARAALAKVGMLAEPKT